MLSPLLFNVFFATILLVARERFSEDADILADLVHGQEQPAKVALKCPGMCAGCYLGDAAC